MKSALTWLIVSIILVLTAMVGRASAQMFGPGVFASAGIAVDVDSTLENATPGVVASLSLGKEWPSIGLRAGVDLPTLLRTRYRFPTRRGASAFFIAEWDGRVSESVRAGFLAGGVIERNLPGIMFGPEAAFALPGHRVVIAPDVRVTLFPLAGAADWYGVWIVRSGVSIRWAM